MTERSEPGCVQRRFLSVVAPPVATYLYGCMGTRCAAPVAVIWLAALIAIGYAFLGGSSNQSGVAWPPLLLGVALWSATTLWTFVLVCSAGSDRAYTDPQVRQKQLEQRQDSHDPMAP